MTGKEEPEDPYTLGLSFSNCSNDNGYLVVDDEVKFNRLIDMINEFQVTSVCEQCSIESEINKMTSKI
jgi:hypothetical protein